MYRYMDVVGILGQDTDEHGEITGLIQLAVYEDGSMRTLVSGVIPEDAIMTLLYRIFRQGSRVTVD